MNSREGTRFIRRSRIQEDFDLTAFQGKNQDFQPAYAWVWNDRIDMKEVRRRLEGMKKAGILCFYILPEPKNFRPGTMRTFMEPDYMTDAYLAMVKETAGLAEELGLRMWLYDEGGWPSGGACGQTVAKTPRLLSKGLKTEAFILKAGETLRAEKEDIAFFAGSDRVREGVSFREDRVITAYRLQYSGGWNTDSLEDGIGKTFVELTHRRYGEALRERIGHQIPLMFTDEPGTGPYPWPTGFAEAFKNRYGYDLTDCLPALWQEDKKTEQIRIDYRELQGELFRKNYLKPIHDWCRENGMLSTGHLDLDHLSDGCLRHGYGHVLPLLREMDIPGVDVIWQQIGMPENGKTCPEGNGFFERFASSAAAQTGGKLALSESFGVYGDGLTGETARMTVNHQLVRGINLFNFMLTAYSPRLALALVERPTFMEEKPGFGHLAGINDYTARASYLMQLGRPGLTTALFYPARDIWAGGERKKKAMQAFENLGRELEEKQVEFDIVDEEALRLCQKMPDGRITMGLACYDTLMLPEGITLSDELKGKTGGLKNQPESVFPCEEKDVRVRTRLLPGGERLCMVFYEGAGRITLPFAFGEARRGVELDAGTAEIRAMKESYTFLPGEAKFFLFGSNLTGEETENREKLLELTDFTLEARHEMLLTAEGLSHRYLQKNIGKAPLGSWKDTLGNDFSGEAVYKTRFILKNPPTDGKIRISLGKVECSARIRLNGEELGIVWADPKALTFDGSLLTRENTLEIEVANTAVNRLQATDMKNIFDPAVLGPYHEKESAYEEKAPRGGLYGPVELWMLKA